MLVAVSAIAAVLTTGSFLPQARQTLRTRRADDFAWGYLAMLGTGIFLWCLYGALAGEPVLFLANIVTLGFVVLIAGVKRSSEVVTRREAAAAGAPAADRPVA